MSANDIRKVRQADVLTSGQAARLCRVAPRTVSLWVDKGVLKGFRIPGTRGNMGDRRIKKKDLIHFMRERGLPLNELMEEAYSVLCLSANETVGRSIEKLLPEGHVGLSLTNMADMIVSMSKNLCKVVLVDWEFGAYDCSTLLQIAMRLTPKVSVIGIVSAETNRDRLLDLGCVDAFYWPLEIADIVDSIKRHGGFLQDLTNGGLCVTE
jgi:hypothetical protein